MSINKIDPKTRSALFDKYSMGLPPDPNNAEAKAILDGERNDPGNWLLCDPKRSPEMYERISKAYRSLRVVFAPERLRAHTERYPCDKVLVWRSHWNCNINIADRCDDTTEPEDLPIPFGGLTMVFKCCGACKTKAVEMAQTGMVLSVIEAHERATKPDDAPDA